ncbi:penicillin-binding protein [Clostridium frigidicarnis]|uniref:Penicillin-binding protein n=1 Tax=Clostridium frigidicarnis TaxID=84698 RepID=A0A1I0X4K2_9CLOT|nr:penicillin-binding protein [Clostridium frigidicarnis]
MNKKIIYMCVSIILIIGIAWMVIVYVNKNSSQAKDGLNEYIELLNKKDYEAMYEMISNESKEKYSKDDFILRNKNIYNGIEASNIKVEINNISKEGDEKILNFDTTMDTLSGELKFSNSINMRKNEGEKKYSLVWNSQAIFPELGEEDKVKVSKDKAKRGDILDRNGVALAIDGNNSEVGVIPGKLGQGKDQILKEISDILEMSIDDINKKLSASYVRDDMFIPLKVIAQKDERVNRLLKMQGVMINDKAARVYPLGEGAGHLTGYVQNISMEELEKYKDDEYRSDSVIGKSGLEKIYEEQLRGIDGFEIYIVDKNDKKKVTLLSKEVKNGKDIQLTIDSEMQSLVYTELLNDAGASVAMNPNTGEVLALVSSPSYNPNDFIMGMSEDKWKSLNEDSKKPLYNRFQSNLCPGSVFKPFTAAIGLDVNSIDPDENKNISGLKWQKDSSWGGYFVTRVKDYGLNTNLLNALIYSDNIYFAQSAVNIGKDVFADNLKKLGLGESIPFEYGMSKSQFAIDGEIKTDIQLADSGYGQGEILLNPLQLASMYTLFLNDGNMLKPSLEYKEKVEPSIWKNNVISKKSADIVLNDLIQVVDNPNGTGHGAHIDGLSIAGKTGTAEIKLTQDDTKGTELGWFTAMTTNRNENNLLVVAMVEDAKEKGGSHYVVPKVKKVFETLK